MDERKVKTRLRSRQARNDTLLRPNRGFRSSRLDSINLIGMFSQKYFELQIEKLRNRSFFSRLWQYISRVTRWSIVGILHSKLCLTSRTCLLMQPFCCSVQQDQMIIPLQLSDNFIGIEKVGFMLTGNICTYEGAMFRPRCFGSLVTDAHSTAIAENSFELQNPGFFCRSARSTRNQRDY